jgi:hypothetical protein
MKFDAVAALSDIALVVSFCSATAPVAFSNTGRIALDRLRDPVHRIDRACGVLLQRVDLLRFPR